MSLLSRTMAGVALGTTIFKYPASTCVANQRFQQIPIKFQTFCKILDFLECVWKILEILANKIPDKFVTFWNCTDSLEFDLCLGFKLKPKFQTVWKIPESLEFVWNFFVWYFLKFSRKIPESLEFPKKSGIGLEF